MEKVLPNSGVRDLGKIYSVAVDVGEFVSAVLKTVFLVDVFLLGVLAWLLRRFHC